MATPDQDHELETLLGKLTLEDVPPAKPERADRWMSAYMAAARTGGQPQQLAARTVRPLFRLVRPAFGLGFVAAGALLALCLAVVLTGGIRPPEVAVLTNGGVATRVRQLRAAPLRLFTWTTTNDVPANAQLSVAAGDAIVAMTTVTLTFADGSVSVLAPGTLASTFADAAVAGGIHIESGAVASLVAPRRDDLAAFVIQSPHARYTVKGTVFRVHTEAVGDLLTTDEGVVNARNEQAQVDVGAGEQLSITRAQSSLAVGVQPPVLEARDAFSPSRLLEDGAGAQAVVVTARGLPRGELTLVARRAGLSNPQQFSARLNDRGQTRVELPLSQDGAYTLTGIIGAPDGRQSAESAPIIFTRDTRPPRLVIAAITISGAGIVVRGQTEPGAQVTINGAPAITQPDGSFELQTGSGAQNAIRIVSMDDAGNQTVVDQQP